MEKLRDGKIDLRQPRLFTDLVGKVHEQRTAVAITKRPAGAWRSAIGAGDAICRSRWLNSNIPAKVPFANKELRKVPTTPFPFRSPAGRFQEVPPGELRV